MPSPRPMPREEVPGERPDDPGALDRRRVILGEQIRLVWKENNIRPLRQHLFRRNVRIALAVGEHVVTARVLHEP